MVTLTPPDAAPAPPQPSAAHSPRARSSCLSKGTPSMVLGLTLIHPQNLTRIAMHLSNTLILLEYWHFQNVRTPYLGVGSAVIGVLSQNPVASPSRRPVHSFQGNFYLTSPSVLRVPWLTSHFPCSFLYNASLLVRTNSTVNLCNLPESPGVFENAGSLILRSSE